MNERSETPLDQPDDDRTPGTSSGPSASTGSAHEAVATLVTGGLPLESGLRALSEEAPSRRLRVALRRMSNELASGKSPEEVLARSQRGMPNYLRGLVRAGVQTGQLGAMLEQFLLSIRRRREAKQRFWQMMAYPLLLMPFVAMIGTVLLAYIVPRFRDIFADFGVELPAMTMLLLALSSRTMVIGLFIGIPLLVVLAVVAIVIGPFVPGHATRLRWFQRVPLIGTPSRMRGLSEFCSLLALLMRGQIPLPEALTMTSSALNDANLRQGARKLAARVEQGDSLESATLGLPHISAELRSLFRWEPRGNAFADILWRAGEVYAARSQVQAGISLLFLQPIIFVGLTMFVGFVVLSLFMPLIKLLDDLT